MAKVVISDFEKTAAKENTHTITMINDNGASVTLCDFGATVMALTVPDQNGKMRDVVLGYKHIADYAKNDTYFGATIGRCCNRICKGHFTLNGKNYQLAVNNGENHLHGGCLGFNARVWDYTVEENKVTFSLLSKDGEENYPGNLNVTVCYTFDDTNTLTISYDALSDQDTICNLTNHMYFNLDGHQGKTIVGQYVKINAQAYLPINASSIPTGEIKNVKGTVFDFTSYKKIGDALLQEDEQLDLAKGMDHTFVLDQSESENASAYSEKSGIKLICSTTQKGIHVYTANYVDVSSERAKEDAVYGENSAFCFETQNFPDAINQTNFPSVVLKAGERYHKVTKFSFTTIHTN